MMIIALDFDGVVANTTDLKGQLFLQLFSSEEYYPHVLSYESENHSKPRLTKISAIYDLLQATDYKNKLPSRQDFINHYLNLYGQLLETELPKADLVQGFAEFYNYLVKNNITIYVVSAAVESEIKFFLKAHGFNNVKHVFDFKVEKAKALKEISQIENIAVGKILFFGDNLSDLKAALEAGTAFVAINSKISDPNLKYKFDNFSEIPKEFFEKLI